VEAVRIGRATTLIPFVRFLSDLGAPVERELEAHRLPVALLQSPESYIPTLNNWGFLDTMARSEGVTDLGLRVAGRAHLGLLSRSLRGKLHTASTLLSVMRILCHEAARESSGMVCWLSRRGQRGDEAIEFHLEKSFGPDTPGYSETEWFGLLGMMAVVRLYAGPQWQSATVSLRSRRPLPELAGELFPETRFATGQPSLFFTVPSHLLRLRLKRESLVSAAGSGTDEAPASDLLGCLRQLLPAYLADGQPHLELAAALLGTSTRSLQRRLAAEDLSYSALVEDVRMHTASQLLAETDRSVLEISQLVGYSDPSNFARAFRRGAGVSPTRLRRGRRDEQSAIPS
jgi:AraC-like DNA-binding protein